MAPPRRRELSDDDLARLHYLEELERDIRARNCPLSDEEETNIREQIFAVSPSTVASWNRLTAATYESALLRIISGEAGFDEIRAGVGVNFDEFRDRGFINVVEGSAQWRAKARTIATVQLEALRRSLERDQGNFFGKPSYPPLHDAMSTEALAEVVPLEQLLSGYCAELQRSGRGHEAERRWRPCFASLVDFLKHDDATQLTRQDVMRWKDHLLVTLQPKTVRDSHLAALKTVLTWAVDAGRLATNVATGVKVRAPKPLRVREKGFTEKEAKAILAAAREYEPKKTANPRTSEATFMTAAKRWVPWLCAHTGARVAEITQLRLEDVFLDASIPHIRITPEAGSVKSGQYRDVPIHRELFSIGFAEFVRGSASGPLFYAPSQRKAGGQPPQKQVAGRIASWVRSLKIISLDVDPSHGWRHRMKTVARDVGLDARVIDALQGHAARTAGEGYGDVSLVAKSRTILEIPRYFPESL